MAAAAGAEEGRLIGADSRRFHLPAKSEDGRRILVSDKVTGITAAEAITAACLPANARVAPLHVRLSMLDATVAFLCTSDMGSQTFLHGELPQREAASFQDLVYKTTS